MHVRIILIVESQFNLKKKNTATALINITFKFFTSQASLTKEILKMSSVDFYLRQKNTTLELKIKYRRQCPQLDAASSINS